MLFNSLEFAVFLPVVFMIYWSLNRFLRIQTFALLIASYFFYGWWDWRFLSLLLFSTLVNYLTALGLDVYEAKSKRRILLTISILVNLGLLGFFKYFNFFLDNFDTVFSFFGADIKTGYLKIILPIGISFYTFQTLSYSVDVYRRKIKPTKDFIAFGTYVSFFPQLVAGPIERATNLLPQFYSKRTFDRHKAIDGLRQILWGLFKKIVIADNCAYYANDIFNHSSDYSGSTLVIGALFFAFQIYCDFSGYSDIAIGTARLFGFNLMRNFAFPYFSRDIAEFWRRWHISLSSWFRDYLYIPIGGSKGGEWMKIRNILIIFIVSGFWHGANWTFIIWGLLNAIYIMPSIIRKTNRNYLEIVAKGKFFPTLKELLLILTTFGLTLFAWIFFRADNIQHAFSFISEILSASLFTSPHFSGEKNVWLLVILVILFLMIEWFGREQQYAIEKLALRWNKPLRWAFYYIIAMTIFLFAGKEQEFIYFQF